MTDTVKIISPIDGRVYAERKVASGAEIEAAVSRSKHARANWGQLTIKERAKYMEHFLDALLAAGLKGIEDKLELEPAFTGDAYTGKKLREVPKTLRHAIDSLRKSKMLKEAMGEQAVSHYVHTAEWEQFEYDRRITDWELKRGFERS